jgi:hypothetical protein
MANESSQTVLIYAILVVFLMMGVAAMGLMSVMMDDKDKDYKASHDYSVSGTYMGYGASGTGESKYINESQREYMYHFTVEIVYGESKGTMAFDVICGDDKVPVEIYTKGSSETIGGADCVWWSYTPNPMLCEFAIDSSMVVHQFRLTASDGSWALVGDLADGKRWERK